MLKLFVGYNDRFRNDKYKNEFKKYGFGDFLRGFYTPYGMSFSVRTEYFMFDRDKKLEDDFYNKVNPQNHNYILIHEDTKRNVLVNRKFMKNNNNLKVINLDNISNIYFDTIKLIENAKEIYGIDSCWMIFIYLLDAKYKILNSKKTKVVVNCLRGYEFMYNEPVLDNWELIPRLKCKQ